MSGLKQIEEALQALRDGKIIVYPTETSYGLGCDATNEEAVEKIFKMKGREAGKGLPLILPSRESALQFVEFSSKAASLADKYWPGPLNIIASVKKGSPIAPACSQDGTQSVRLSSHPFTSTLAKRFGKPLVATSANVAGAEAIYDVADIERVFSDRPVQPDLIVDGGVLPKVPASTTVKMVGDKVVVVRQGQIAITERLLS
ncbi:threonylcarbamoyl-AMP synthase [Patescibacteria group bacterium]|nr:threonylcarbamoyl-AMP synthase [Patescibacteria group bacterium]